ncbi:aminotransferase class I/II-fold pyridoxal phosphate-dependent enzyme [Bacillus xiapuensis]|uniref:aminotransferase class I/II-fold pyridoxal phosphate-dependent enzyme n=1 Tax=Bacillus xiapuensis TaxID=2014075 RepID=UPI000C24213A|nr:aminotransferase class I/II-fold pyridoxal phosphate-dependent enzyme [Bacillus xiapuensis]
MKMDHSAAPLYEALCLYEDCKRISLHVPGHKDGRVFDETALERFSGILKIDATESKGIDDLHHPTDFIKEAQQLAADAFGADHTFFLVGGSTIGNIAVALSLCAPGDKILVQRNMHKSVFHGLTLAGAQPVFIAPGVESATKAAKVSDFGYIEKALKENQNVKGLWITNPNYYGMSQDISVLAEMCHRKHVPLIVDEAHGAHFGQANPVPPSALSKGADIVVQSTHKMLTAMTMASMLHVKGHLVSQKRLAQVLGMLQSTSPSYPLLASLDLARRYLVTKGRSFLQDTAERLEKKRLDLTPKLKTLTIWGGSEEVDYRDPLKWIISCRSQAATGYQLLDLFYQLGCTAEISDPQNIVFLFSINEQEKDMDQVVNAIMELDHNLNKQQLVEPQKLTHTMLFAEEGALLQPPISLGEAFQMPRKKVALEDAGGALCGEMILPYPPGIPLLIPGEEITSAHIQTIRQLKEMGAYFQSPSDVTLKSILILDQTI